MGSGAEPQRGLGQSPSGVWGRAPAGVRAGKPRRGLGGSTKERFTHQAPTGRFLTQARWSCAFMRHLPVSLHGLRIFCSRCIRKHGRRLTYGEPNGYERLDPRAEQGNCAHEEETAEDLQMAKSPQRGHRRRYCKEVGPPLSGGTAMQRTAGKAESICRSVGRFHLSRVRHVVMGARSLGAPT